ncbi:MAG TPA: alpha/beta fold hydrolase [Burkholderiales bacterium]|nr:alpha/beta fold hydrolase [Burkholderiales bacterium]
MGSAASPLSSYRAPAWLPGGHLQTLYAALLAPRPRPQYRRERWETPDGDFVDVDWLQTPSAVSREPSAGTRHAKNAHDAHQPLVVLFHGLEGCSASHYAHAVMSEVSAIGWQGAVVHFRGCSGSPNRLARAYHSGDSAELDWMLRRLRAERSGPLYAVGVSLGGNVLLKWLGEHRSAAADIVSATAAVSAPVDLTAAGNALGRGFNLVYTSAFLRTLKRKSLAKLERHAKLYDAARVRRARTLRAFDNVVTAPLHGFRDTDDYWHRASSKPMLRHISVPTLMLNARNDPFLPEQALPSAEEVSGFVTRDFPGEGGHVGFVSGAFPGQLRWMPQRILTFLGHRGC